MINKIFWLRRTKYLNYLSEFVINNYYVNFSVEVKKIEKCCIKKLWDEGTK